MTSRQFLLGLLVGSLGGLLLFGVQAWGFTGGGGPALLPDSRDAAGWHGDTVESLRQEIEKLRAQLRASSASGPMEEERVQSQRPGESTATGIALMDETARAARGRGEQMSELLKELRELVKQGALEKRFQDPQSLLQFLAQTWMEIGAPERVVSLLARFEMDEMLAQYALQAIEGLQEKGDRSTAMQACLLVARSGHNRDELVQFAMDLDPARVLEELDAASVGQDWGEEWPAQRGALLLAAGDTKAALAIIDGYLSGKQGVDLPLWLWPELVQRAPKEAEARLQKRAAATKDPEEKGFLRRGLALALKRQGKREEAVQLMQDMMATQFENDEVVSAFVEVDPTALREWLAQRVRDNPDARSFSLYADSLIAAKQPREAIAAWWQAVRLDPASTAAYNLIQHAPREAAMRLTDGARIRRDDEMLGDIADSLWRLGQKQRARELWEQAHEFDKEDSEWVDKIAKAQGGKDPLR